MIKKILGLVVNCLFIYSYVSCDRTKSKIYLDVDELGTAGCFRRLNGTHQVGCGSSRSGNIGVLHYVEKDEDLDWVLNTGQDYPYVILIKPSLFNDGETMLRIKNSEKVNGILIADHNETDTPEHFSADSSCPNEYSGLYHENSDYQGCQKAKWNPYGTDFLNINFNFPIIVLSNQTSIDNLKEMCFEKYNQSPDEENKGNPLCYVQVNTIMLAAQDTPTCIRRGTGMFFLEQDILCQSLGDYNVLSFSRSFNNSNPDEAIGENTLIIAGARLDSFSTMDGVYPGFDMPASAVITLLAAVHAWGQYKSLLDETHKPVMFTLFQGEAFDYIGSSRMLYDMENGKFLNDDLTINLSHIHQMVEVSQVGKNLDDDIWMHIDPLSMQNVDLQSEITKLKDILKKNAAFTNLTAEDAAEDQPLPPATLQRFLTKINISGVVISDHDSEFSNKYYNSIYDVPTLDYLDYPDNVDKETYTETKLTIRLTKIATVLLRSLVGLSSGETVPDKVEANSTVVAQLAYCFLVSANCTLFKSVLSDELQTETYLPSVPYPFYVGVRSDGTTGRNSVTKLSYLLMAKFLGDEVGTGNFTEEECTELDENDNIHNYIWINNSMTSPSCIKSTAHYSEAISPAFIIEDYDWKSGLYSTWTESQWPAKDTFLVRAFLVPSRKREGLILGLGIVTFLLSMTISYFLNRRGSVLFSTSVNI